jgi:hypothetical protein
MTKETKNKAELTSLRKPISALREHMSSYQSGDPTPERRKGFRLLVKMSSPDVQSARLLLRIVSDCEENEELLQYCEDSGLIDREAFDFYLEPENVKRLRDEIKELLELRKQANKLLKGWAGKIVMRTGGPRSLPCCPG